MRCRRGMFTASVVALVLAGCGMPSESATTLLTAAKSAVDQAHSFHFQLTSMNAGGTGALLTGGTGDALRPSSIRGTLDVTFSGLGVSVPVVSVGGTFYVKLPTDSAFTVAHPADFGFADPAQLIDPQHGLSSLLLHCGSAQVQSDDRYNGESLHEVKCMLPGDLVAALLVSADPSQAVAATFGIAVSNSQLRRVVLTGPFFSKTTLSTFTLVLDNYGENVTITPPPS